MVKRCRAVIRLAFAPVKKWKQGWQMLVSFLILIAPPLAVLLKQSWPLRDTLETSLIFATVAVFIAAYRLHEDLDTVQDGTPKLVCKRISSHPNQIVRTEYSFGGSPPVPVMNSVVVGNPEFYHAHIANEPTGQTDRKVAEKVAARVRISHDNGEAAAEERLHRWEDSPAPGDPRVGKMADRLLPLDIPPSGVEYKLDIAMKYDEDESFHTPNNETVFNGSPDWREERFKFPPGNYTAHVKLQGTNVIANMKFHIVNKGKGSRLDISPL